LRRLLQVPNSQQRPRSLPPLQRGQDFGHAVAATSGTLGRPKDGYGPVTLDRPGLRGAHGGRAAERDQPGVNTRDYGDMSTQGALTTVTGFHDTGDGIYGGNDAKSSEQLSGNDIYRRPATGGEAACDVLSGQGKEMLTQAANRQKALVTRKPRLTLSKD